MQSVTVILILSRSAMHLLSNRINYQEGSRGVDDTCGDSLGDWSVIGLFVFELLLVALLPGNELQRNPFSKKRHGL